MLDEVIKAFEHCSSEKGCWGCPYEYQAVGCPINADVLHYLKEYQEQAKDFDYDELQELRDWYAEEHCNPALSWDELKQMIGKPVWVEADGRESRWDIVMRVTDTHLIPEISLCLHRYWQGKENGWNAYRKERHETDN